MANSHHALDCSTRYRTGRWPVTGRASMPVLTLMLSLTMAVVSHSVSHAATENPSLSDNTQFQRFADTVAVRYQLLDNTPGPHCRQEQAAGACFTAELSLQATEAFHRQDWSIFFSHVSPIQGNEAGEFVIRHLNGDLHELRPTSRFKGFTAGESKRVRFYSAFWLISKADLMPNYYIVAPGLAPRLLRSTLPRIDSETGLEQMPFIADLTDPIRHLRRTPADHSVQATAAAQFTEYQNWSPAVEPPATALLPTPKQIVTRNGELSLKRGIALRNAAFAEGALAAALSRLNQFGVQTTTGGVPVTVQKVPAITLASEAYVLDIHSDRIDIVASDSAGVFYALQSLTGLLKTPGLSVPQLRIEDTPRYPFRGLHFDVARNFHSKQLLLKLIEQLAAYKMNRLHLHLADDEGWRLQIPGLPELTDIGGFRCHDPEEKHCLLPQLGSGPARDNPVNGFFTTADYVELVRAAEAHHIQVIPSLDMPGHARAAVRSMRARHDRLLAVGKKADATRYLLDDAGDQSRYESIQFYRDNTINVCLPSAYAFVDKIISEVQQLHQQAGQPLTRFHIGADETPGAWVGSPACRDYLARHRDEITDVKALGGHFIQKIGAQLRKRGIELAAWSDGVEHLTPDQLPGTVQANAWSLLAWQGHRSAHKLANQGWQVVISSPDVTYFDFPYAADPEEGGYYWGTRSSSTRKVFEFMPDNLPAHAEFWGDREANSYEADDRLQRDAQAQISHAPRRQGVQFHGLQGQLWSETIRRDDHVEYMLFPRVMALAERAWHQAEWELPYQHEGAVYNTSTQAFGETRKAQRNLDWQHFAGLLATREFAKLEARQIAYRLPTVGAIIRDGKLEARVPFAVSNSTSVQGLGIEYRQRNGTWQRYVSPVTVSGAVEVRAVSVNGLRKGRALPVVMP